MNSKRAFGNVVSATALRLASVGTQAQETQPSAPAPDQQAMPETFQKMGGRYLFSRHTGGDEVHGMEITDTRKR